MSQKNVEVVRRAYEATNRGDTDAAYALTHPEIEFHTYAKSPEAGVYRGREAVRRYNEELFGQFKSLRIELEEVIDLGDRVVVVSTQHAVPKGGGTEEIAVSMVELWTVRGGLLTTRRSFGSKQEALEAVGLSEEAMSEENVARVRRMVEVWNRRDVDAVMAFFDPEVELLFRPGVPEPGPFRGIGEVRNWVEGFLAAWADHQVHIEELIDRGPDSVIAVFRHSGRGELSGVELDWRDAHVYTWREGKIVRWRSYETRAEALEAAGLAE